MALAAVHVARVGVQAAGRPTPQPQRQRVMPVCAWRSIATLSVPDAQLWPQARRVARWVPVVAASAFGLQIAQILWVGDLDACRSRSLGAGRGGG